MRKTKKQRFRASILAFLLIASMVLGMAPGSAGQVYAKESTSQTSSEEEPGFIDKAVGFFKDTGEKIASFFGAGDEASPAAAYDTKKEADPDTLQTWQPLAKNTTENIGRIWTDKTVSTKDMEFEGTTHKGKIGDSQFLVALSALSSTSNTVTTSSKPLDIVLVLDVSGSMSNPLQYNYTATYNVDTNRGTNYYAQNEDGTYTKIERVRDWLSGSERWELNGKEVEAKRDANDTTAGRIQFYTRSSAGSKMDALKTAANNFLTETAKQNESISDPNKRHEISVVKFAGNQHTSYGNNTYDEGRYTYNYSQRLNQLTAYNSQTISSLTDMIDSIKEGGATSADYGMQLAQSELDENGRQDAQKVIIFFTDGEPNHSSGFNRDVANNAISASKALKDKKAIVYSIGVFADANPDNTSTNQSNQFNAYMHGISSNYPAATAWNTLGTAAEERKYYKAASDADQLNQIFEDILQDVNTGSGFPTEITQGYEPNEGGYVTFDDQLGAYMQVDAFKSILFADKKFDLDPDTGVETVGNVTTYTFEGEGGNDLYPNGNLHDITITVTKSDDLAVGDQVKVKIPASMIPLRHFSVDTNANGETTMKVKETWPIRLLYGASMKPGVAKTLQDGLDDSPVDQALETYLEANQTKIDGKAAAFFYSNLYTRKSWVGHDGKTLGNTIASFDPAKGNTFYYFTKDTPIYTDENFTQPVKGQPVSGDTYYYKKVFWALEEGTPVKKTIAYPFASDNFNQASASWAVNERDEVYIKAGSAKLTRVDSLTLSKEKNTTKTATEVINPQWDNVNNPQTLLVYLGNNGRVAMEVPGALEITKDATVAADKNLDEQEIVKDKEFTFNISIPEMKDKTVKAEKRNLQGDIQGDAFDLSFDNEGNAKAVLKDNEKIYIHGLDAGIEYTVTEDTNSMPDGFALTAIDGEKVTEATGTIVAGSSKKHTFTNTYDVTTISVEAFAPYEKVFDRWDQAPKFQIMLKADDLSCPMPAESTNGQKVVEVTKNNPKGNFGTITYNKPGTYGYTVIELLQPNDQVIGVDYSLASYDVEVKVSDTGKGTLQVDSVVMRQQNTDEGASIAEPAKVDTATFKNTYNLDSASLAAIVSKNYTDTTGASLTSGQFEFKMTPRKDLDEGTNDPTNNRPKLPQGIQPDENGSIFVKNTGNVANFGYATYDTTCVGNTYAYELTEVVPEGVTVESPKLNGMTYDLQRYLVKMKVTSKKIDGKDAVRVTPTYYVINENAGEETYTEYTPGGTDPYPVFYNTYDPEDLELPSEGNDAIHGSKTLKGRASLEGETFTFTLAAANEASQTALENDWIVFESDENKTNMTATVTAIQNGGKENFNFGKVKFTRPGVYQFNVVENAPENGKGMVYDRHTALVTVTVTDNAGKLEGKVTYNNGQDASTSEAAFTNTYTASTTYGEGAALKLSKTLNGRNQSLEEFKFQIAGQDEAAEQKLADTDREFATIAQANDGVASLIFDKMSGVRFTEADAGKSFSYVVKEVLPQDDDAEVEGVQSKGVTYTQTQYRVDIQVNDNGDGTMSTVTTVSRTHDEKGVLLQPKEVLGTYNSKDGKNDISDISFVNSYAADGTLNGAANLAGTKKMDGPWESTGKDLSGFQFTITGGDEATNTAIKAGTVVLPRNATVTSNEAGNFNFDDITFNKKGTYTFTVSEVVPEADKIPGVAYDAEPVTITVNVTDNDNGTLTAELAEGSPKLTFTNTYATTQDATFTPSVVKKVEGLNAKEVFTFKLSAADDATKQAIDNDTITGIGTRADKYSSEKTTTGVITKDNPQTVNFDELTFKKAGTYQFTVKETNANAPTGWTYDGHTYKITINVTDVASVLKAQMGITDPNTNSQIFTNSFKATTTYGDEGGLDVTKTLNGRTLAADMFEFTITGVATDTVTAEKANAKLENTDKNFKNTAPGEDSVAVMSKLGAVKFKETDIGKTYQYAVQESTGTDTKYTYDNVSATVAIQVLEKDGGLYTVTTVTKGKDVKTYSSINGKATAVAPFVNSYTPNIVNVEPGTFAGSVTKVLKGNRGAELAAGEFNFQMTITAKDGSDMNNVVLPEGANNGTVTAANKADGSVSFGNIQFKAAGTYHVEISEVIPEKKDPNMTYDKHTFSYDIEVTYDASKGELSVKAVEDSKSGSPVFTNIYEADDAKDVANTKEPTTSVNGKVVGVGDRLTYTIDWVNNAVDETTGAPVKAEVTIKDIVPEGTKYVSADNEGAYDQGTNTITWTLGEQEAGASGTVSFVVEVLDNAGGTDVTNKAEIMVGNNDPKQTNEVTTKVPGKESKVEGDGELQVGKVLTYTISYKNPEEEAATVTIKDIIPEGLDYVEGSASNGAAYNEEDRTLTWTIADVQPGTEGTVTFDAKVNENAETVIDNKATIQIGDNAPTYGTNTNQNEIPKDGNLAISKTIALAEGQGTEINKEQTFTFTVELKDAKGSALTKEYAYTVTDGDQETAKDKIANAGTISLKHGQKATITGLPAGAQYKVTETKADGYTADALVKEGTVAAAKTANADFTNTYSVAGSLSGSDALTVTKKLVGREWLDTDRFAYALTPADEATATAVNDGFITLPANADSLEITNAFAEHQAAFGDIQFTIAGTFKFNVTERPSGIAGIMDDKNAERTVVVNVTDKKDGTLKIAIVEDESENLTFTNTYGASTVDEDIAAQIPATKKLTGRDMKAEEFQFEVVTRKADEKAKNFKEERVATGTNVAARAGEAGTVKFAGKDNVKLTYTVESLNQAVKDGYAVKNVQNGQNVWTVSYTARELTDNLPGGVKAVEGKTSYDFGILVTDNNNGTLTAQVQAPDRGIAFENAYTTGGTEVDTDPTDKVAYFNKKLVGRDWLDTDEFTFTITPQNGAPEPKKTIATVEKAEAKEGDLVPFGFGKITFTDADMAGATANEDGTLSKTFTYQITENDIDAKKMPGVTKDIHVATLTITVTDNQQGELSASASMTAENGTFINTYESSLDYTALSGLQITKVLHGRDMEAGQFTFTVTPEDKDSKDSAEKLGLAGGANEFKNTAKPAGGVDTIDVLAGKNVTFTQEDAGKTFTYTVAEKAGDNEAYTYDDTLRTVTIEVKDNKNATLTVTTTVKKGSEVVDTQSVTTGDEGQKKATVAFVNTYNVKPETLGGDGEVKINAKKTLTNRPMVADEFKFHVKDNKNETVTSGTNSADGTITFAPVTYDTDKLIEDAKAGIAAKSVKEGAYVYTYDYKVVEAPTTDGVTGDATTFAIQVIVTDKGDGTLELKVQYPEGTDSLAFKNLYGEGAEAEITINGHKQYEVASGDNEPDITGKYTFTITGSKGAPMPEKTEVTNDAAGNVTFGAITYTMENVFGDTGSKPEVAEAAEGAAEDEAEGDEKDLTEAKSAKREKTFTYTVAESGGVPGVQNDGSSKTFTVKVTDNGNGTIAVEKSWKENEFPFSFTNTYSVTPADYSINTDLTITKELDGRELREGEFTFEMVGEGETVLQEAVNAKDGSVTFGALTYEKPGTYNYVIREQKGSAGGVEYDSAEHTVVVVVTDNGDGTMTAKAELKSRDDEDAKNAIVFKNSYTAQPASVTLGASKAYTGGKLGDGQFTFELRDESDKLISKAKNNENGQIVFETIEYKNVGTYKYKISEVNDEQKHVTYDKTVYGVTVTVTDNQEGSLMAAVEYDGGKAPVFTNKYSKPAKPAKPEEPKGPTAVKTGDEAPVIPFIILMVATLAIIVTITFIFFRRKRR